MPQQDSDPAALMELSALRTRVADLEARLAEAAADQRALAALERLGRRSAGIEDRNALLEAVLDELLETFDCDRSWLLYPCDPTADSWGIPMERTREGWPGVFAFDVRLPMDEGAAGIFAEALATNGPLPFDATTERQVPPEVAEAFEVRAQLVMAIYPHGDEAWLLGIHHCRRDVVFGPADLRLFTVIGERIAQALDAMVMAQALTEHEQQLARVQRMEAVGSLAGGIAHDFNNMLLVISGNAELIKLRSGGDERIDRCSSQILRASDSGVQLTRQLLAFSRRSVLTPRVIDVASLVRDDERILRSILGGGVELHLDLPDAPVATRADPGQLEQVLINLVTNARDAMGRTGRVEIRVDRVQLAAGEVRGLDGGAYARLAVEDTGPGMSEEVSARIFEPFFTTKERGQGTGLGLSTAFGFLRQSGGSITVVTAPGEGARFTVLLPASDGEPVAADTWAPVSARGGGESILLVDDQADVAEVAMKLLKHGGYQVEIASSAAEALEVLAARGADFDLMITDVVMPGTDGVALVEQARKLLPDLRVTFATGYATRSVERLRDAGLATTLLQKPYTAEQLFAHIRKVLARDDDATA